jgi:hypothetical protein
MNFLKTLLLKNRKVKRVYKKKSFKTSSKSNVDQQKIDLILDKISKSGYDSLTKSEKDTLFKAGQN